MLPDAAFHGVDQPSQLLLSTTVNIQAGVVEQDHHAVLQVMLPPLHWEVTKQSTVNTLVTVFAGRFSARGQDDLPSSTVSGLLSLTEISLNVPPAVIALRLAHHHPPVEMAIFIYSYSHIIGSG